MRLQTTRKISWPISTVPYGPTIREGAATGEREWQCQYCGVYLTCKASLIRHIRIHTGERPYKCIFCTYAALQKSDLVRHIRCKHKETSPAHV